MPRGPLDASGPDASNQLIRELNGYKHSAVAYLTSVNQPVAARVKMRQPCRAPRAQHAPNGHMHQVMIDNDPEVWCVVCISQGGAQTAHMPHAGGARSSLML